MITPGSGGFGPVAQRDRSAIGRDLANGYITLDAARNATKPAVVLKVHDGKTVYVATVNPD